MVKRMNDHWNLSGICILAAFSVFGLCGCIEDPSTESSDIADLDVTMREKREAAESATEQPDEPLPFEIPSAGPHPKFVAKEMNHRFGQMAVGTKQSHEFTISNEGEAPLKLRVRRTTCKCTQFRLSSEEIAPGGSATIYMEWEGKAATENFKHSGILYTNDPINREVLFNTIGVVVDPIVFQPEEVWNFGVISSKEPGTVEGLMYSPILSDLTINDVKTDLGLVDISYEPMSDAEKQTTQTENGWKFKLTLPPDFPAGDFRDRLIISTDQVNEPVSINLLALRRSEIKISGTRGVRFDPSSRFLTLGQFPVSKGRSADLLVTIDQTIMPDDFRITEYRSSPAGFQVSLSPIGKPTGKTARYRLTIDYPSGSMRAQRNFSEPGMIHLTTNHPNEPLLLIKVGMSAH